MGISLFVLCKARGEQVPPDSTNRTSKFLSSSPHPLIPPSFTGAKVYAVEGIRDSLFPGEGAAFGPEGGKEGVVQLRAGDQDQSLVVHQIGDGDRALDGIAESFGGAIESDRLLHF